MDPAQFLTAPRVTIVAGKGGVGKTTTALAMAVAATHAGLNALLIEIEGKSAVASLYGQQSLRYDDTVLIPRGATTGELRARTIQPDDALTEYLQQHGLRTIANRLIATGALEMIATATPGIRDVLVLGKIKQLEQQAVADVIVVDAPAAGHAITFLRSASGLLDAVAVGPIETQAREVTELLRDPQRCQVMLVTLPEETPVNELVETAFQLEDTIGVALAPVVVNGVYPELTGLDVPLGDHVTDVVADDASKFPEQLELTAEQLQALQRGAQFRRDRMALQRIQIDRLNRSLPIPQLHLPALFTSQLHPRDLDVLADALLHGIEDLR